MSEEQRSKNPEPEVDSIAPVTGKSIEAQAAAMEKGKSRHLLGGVATAVVLGVGGLIMLFYIDRGEDYHGAVNALGAIEQEQLDGYLKCALPGVSTSQLNTAMRVFTTFESMGERLGKKYGATLAQCEPRLSQLASSVEALEVPKKFSDKRAQLSAAVEQLKEAQASYRSYLDDSSKAFEIADATPFIDGMSEAWQGYKNAHKELSDALKAKL